MKQFQFKKGPLISACFLTSSTHILKITLSHSPSFQAKIEGPANAPLVDKIYHWLECYQNGSALPKLPLEIPPLSSFGNKVIHALANVAFGETISYQGLALRASSSRAARAAGSYCRKNLFPLVIPCHRIVLANGSIGNFLYGPKMKQEMLDFERASKNNNT